MTKRRLDQMYPMRAGLTIESFLSELSSAKKVKGLRMADILISEHLTPVEPPVDISQTQFRQTQWSTEHDTTVATTTPVQQTSLTTEVITRRQTLGDPLISYRNTDYSTDWETSVGTKSVVYQTRVNTDKSRVTQRSTEGTDIVNTVFYDRAPQQTYMWYLRIIATRSKVEMGVVGRVEGGWVYEDAHNVKDIYDNHIATMGMQLETELVVVPESERKPGKGDGLAKQWIGVALKATSTGGYFHGALGKAGYDKATAEQHSAAILGSGEDLPTRAVLPICGDANTFSSRRETVQTTYERNTDVTTYYNAQTEHDTTRQSERFRQTDKLTDVQTEVVDAGIPRHTDGSTAFITSWYTDSEPTRQTEGLTEFSSDHSAQTSVTTTWDTSTTGGGSQTSRSTTKSTTTTVTTDGSGTITSKTTQVSTADDAAYSTEWTTSVAGGQINTSVATTKTTTWSTGGVQNTTSNTTTSWSANVNTSKQTVTSGYVTIASHNNKSTSWGTVISDGDYSQQTRTGARTTTLAAGTTIGTGVYSSTALYAPQTKTRNTTEVLDYGHITGHDTLYDYETSVRTSLGTGQTYYETDIWHRRHYTSRDTIKDRLTDVITQQSYYTRYNGGTGQVSTSWTTEYVERGAHMRTTRIDTAYSSRTVIKNTTISSNTMAPTAKATSHNTTTQWSTGGSQNTSKSTQGSTTRQTQGVAGSRTTSQSTAGSGSKQTDITTEWNTGGSVQTTTNTSTSYTTSWTTGGGELLTSKTTQVSTSVGQSTGVETEWTTAGDAEHVNTTVQTNKTTEWSTSSSGYSTSKSTATSKTTQKSTSVSVSTAVSGTVESKYERHTLWSTAIEDGVYSQQTQDGAHVTVLAAGTSVGTASYRSTTLSGGGSSSRSTSKFTGGHLTAHDTDYTFQTDYYSYYNANTYVRRTTNYVDQNGVNGFRFTDAMQSTQKRKLTSRSTVMVNDTAYNTGGHNTTFSTTVQNAGASSRQTYKITASGSRTVQVNTTRTTTSSQNTQASTTGNTTTSWSVGGGSTNTSKATQVSTQRSTEKPGGDRTTSIMTDLSTSATRQTDVTTEWYVSGDGTSVQTSAETQYTTTFNSSGERTTVWDTDLDGGNTTVATVYQTTVDTVI